MPQSSIHRLVKGTLILALTCLIPATRAAQQDTDYDGDGKDDLSVYCAADGNWFILQSSDNALRWINWGWQQTQPVPGDYDGDGKADLCVFHARAGNWYIINSSDGSSEIFNWGWSTTLPVSGDFDGDGMNDTAVFDPDGGNWYIVNSSDSSATILNWGWSESEPVPADYDGDGKTDPAVFDPATGNWYLYLSDSDPCISAWGWYGVAPVPGDYDADDIADLAVFDPTAHKWYIQRSSDAVMSVVDWGMDSTQPVPADYDGDYITDLSVYAPDTGYWLIQQSSDGIMRTAQWGWSTTEPCTASIRTYMHMFPTSHDYDNDYYENRRQVPSDFEGVEWLHSDVSGWSQTATLSEVTVTSSHITLDYNKANSWPAVYTAGASVVANPWIFVPKDGGGWYAATWEWLRPGQTTKSRSSVAGDHIKESPLQNFQPTPGEWYGFMVSGLARSSVRNVYERSNVVMVQWPD